MFAFKSIMPFGANAKESDSLKKYNYACFWAHFLQSLAAIIYTVYSDQARDFRVYILTHYADWDPDLGPKSATQVIGTFPLAAVTCAVPMLSAIAHLYIGLTYVNYRQRIAEFTNTVRWIEYAFSSTLMFFLICLLFSIYDISTLIALACINATVMFCGYVMEQQNYELLKTGAKPILTSFYVGCSIGVVQWALLYSTLSVTDGSMPAIIWALLFTYAVLYMLFAVNMFVLYNYSEGKNNTIRYINSEKYYMILSLTSKSLLLWLILSGVNQPNTFTST
jgi:hypothetical protein